MGGELLRIVSALATLPPFRVGTGVGCLHKNRYIKLNALLSIVKPLSLRSQGVKEPSRPVCFAAAILSFFRGQNTRITPSFWQFAGTNPLKSLNESIGFVQQFHWFRSTNPLISFQQTAAFAG
jgi:hypothetical protein